MYKVLYHHRLFPTIFHIYWDRQENELFLNDPKLLNPKFEKNCGFGFPGASDKSSI
jgi:hypothetical protein